MLKISKEDLTYELFTTKMGYLAQELENALPRMHANQVLETPSQPNSSALGTKSTYLKFKKKKKEVTCPLLGRSMNVCS